jgi:hypothetical protein
MALRGTVLAGDSARPTLGEAEAVHQHADRPHLRNGLRIFPWRSPCRRGCRASDRPRSALARDSPSRFQGSGQGSSETWKVPSSSRSRRPETTAVTCEVSGTSSAFVADDQAVEAVAGSTTGNHCTPTPCPIAKGHRAGAGAGAHLGAWVRRLTGVIADPIDPDHLLP